LQLQRVQQKAISMQGEVLVLLPAGMHNLTQHMERQAFWRISSWPQ
jgi:hypothetical protein